MNVNCKRCGRCCYYHDHNGNFYPCRFLKQLKDKTYCTRYERRLGTYVGYGQYCTLESIYNIPGCPYNNERKPDHPYWKTQKVL